MTQRALVVVNFGSHHLLQANLATCLPEGHGMQVVVVDNFSSAQERTAVTALAQKHGWALLPMSANVGFGVAMNAGVDEAVRRGCESFLLLNPDAVVDLPTVTALLEDVEANRLDLVSPLIRESSGRLVFRGSELDLASGHLQGLAGIGPAPAGRAERHVLEQTTDGRRPWLTGACLAIHRELYDLIGGFARDYFLYWEDVDLSLRVVDAGGALVLRRDLFAVHDEGGTQERSTSRAKSDHYYFYNCRNRLLFATEHLSGKDAARWVLRTPVESTAIWLRGGRRQLLTEPSSVLAAVRGTGSGLAIVARKALSQNASRHTASRVEVTR